MQEYNKASAWFNDLYEKHKNNYDNIPWARQAVNPLLHSYIEDRTHVHKGKALVIGCGLGDDAHALELAGYDVLAIDVSEVALELAQKRSENSTIRYEKQDIFDMPPKYRAHFDFVFEALTIQSLPIEFREKMINAISETLAPEGKLLVVAHKRKKDMSGPPWPLTQEEIDLFRVAENLKELSLELHTEESQISSQKFRALYQK